MTDPGSTSSLPPEPAPAAPYAHLGGRLATGLLEVTDDPAALDGDGWWAVVLTYEGALTCARFADVREVPLPAPGDSWRGPALGAWTSSLGREAYVGAVEVVRRAIADGTVYQANICRVMSAPVPVPELAGPGRTGAPGACLAGLAARLAAGNPSPYAGVVDLGPGGPQVVSASPELFLSLRGDVIESRPIKGTATTAEAMLPKDEAENVMIVDLVRNDLGRVCETGSIEVSSLLALEEHPGLVHLVSTVRGRLRRDVGWADVLDATFPPGSVTGAPKSSAVQVIAALEPVPRGPYCGAVGWVDADARTAELAVGIRTFWFEQGMLRFGTGAGITWSSDPESEWLETELKAARLVALASDDEEDR